MASLHLLVGPPASGKSTYASSFASVQWICADQIRADRFGGSHDVWGDERQFMAWRRWSFREAERRATDALQAGQDVLFDITACLVRERAHVLESLGSLSKRNIGHVFRTPLPVCAADPGTRPFIGS